MKKQRSKEQVQLVSKLNAYILPVFGCIFLFLAFENEKWNTMSTLMLLFAIFFIVYGTFRVYLIQKLTKEVDTISEQELEDMQKDNQSKEA